LQLKKPNKIEKTIQDNPLLSERQKILDEKKATRDSITGRKLIQEKRKQNTRKDDKK
jgi:hypothetical protein